MSTDAVKAFEAALALHKRGDLEGAQQAFADLAGGDPPPGAPIRADALHMQGLIAFQSESLDAAIGLIHQALELDDGVALYHRNLGRVYRAAHKPHEALQAFDRAVALGLDDADILADRADALNSLGRHEEAETAAAEAIAKDNDSGRANLMLGLARFERGDRAGAAAPLGRAVLLNPNDPAANHHRARLLQAAGDLAAAAEHYGRALAEVPDFVEALNNLANVRRAQGRILDAEEMFRKAAEIAPNVAAVHMNHGVALQEIDEGDEALRAYERAIDLDPGLAEARRNRALLWLRKGRLAEGFEEYEWRWKTKTFQAVKPPVEAPRWSSEPTNGTLVFWSEQGIGDAIQFVRYAPIIKQRMRDGGRDGGRLVVVAPASVKTLFETVDGVDEVCTPADAPEKADWQLPMMSAPYVIGTTLSTIPAGCPYLHPSEGALAEWEHLAEPGMLNVGLVWSGDDRHINDSQRSVPAGLFLPLVGIPGVKVNLLQVGPASDQSGELVRQGARQVGHRFASFDCTAGAIAALDLVISVDTAVAHLTGALAKPVWIPISTVQDWRWFEFLEDSPWYPSARIFRQQAPGEWGPVVNEIVDELKTLAEKRSASVEA